MPETKAANRTVSAILSVEISSTAGKALYIGTVMGGERMAQTETQLANLEKGKKTQFKSGENAAENGRKGGIASGEEKRARKTIRKELETLLSMPAKDKHGKETGHTVQTAIIVALVAKASKGDTKAFELIRDTIGEKPAERITLAQIDQDTIDEVEKMVMGDDA
jgi:hypothetical protein